MRKRIVGLLLALALVSGASAAGAQEEATRSGDPIAQLTGDVWQKTSPDNKAAFLFGMDTAIAVEYAVNGKLTEAAAAREAPPARPVLRKERRERLFFMTSPSEKTADVPAA